MILFLYPLTTLYQINQLQKLLLVSQGYAFSIYYYRSQHLFYN